MLLCFAQHLQSLCSLLTCLRLTHCCFCLLRTSSRSTRCRLVLTVSTFLALCWTARLAPRVVQLSLNNLTVYFRRTCSCKLLCSLPIEFPSAHVSFTQAFRVFDLFIIALNYFSVQLLSVLLLLQPSVFSSTELSHAVATRTVYPLWCTQYCH